MENTIRELKATLGKMDIALSAIEECIVWLDNNARIEWCNKAFNTLIDKPRIHILGQKIIDLLPIKQDARLISEVELLRKMTSQGDGSHQTIFDFTTPNGDLLRLQAKISGVGDDSGIIVLVIRDITAEERARQARERAEAELKATHENLEREVYQRTIELTEANEQLILLSEVSDFLQACLTMEEACKSIGTLVQPLFNNCSGGVFLINSSRNLVELGTTWGDNLNSDSIFHPHECWALRRGRIHWVGVNRIGLCCNHVHPSLPITESLCIPMIAQGETIGLLYLYANENSKLSEAKQQLAHTVAEQIALAIANIRLRETLQNQSIRDSLTGLFNRRYLEEFLNQEIHRAERYQHDIGVIMVDIDFFKKFNDSFGHEAGDLVLKEVSKVIRHGIRRSDVACRYGGEEMTILLPQSSLDNAVKRAEVLRLSISKLRVQHHGHSLGNISASFGVASFPHHGNTAQTLLHAADAALYQAKAAGRNRVVAALDYHSWECDTKECDTKGYESVRPPSPSPDGDRGSSGSADATEVTG